MQLPLSGGCACGALRFNCKTAALAMYNCHCRGCQRASGAAFVPILICAADAFTLSGPSFSFPLSNPQDQHSARQVCTQCGAPVCARSADVPEIVLIPALALDDPGVFDPIADIWTVHAQPWACMDMHIPKVYKAPPLLERVDEQGLRHRSH